jgi:hypothetical protein
LNKKISNPLNHESPQNNSRQFLASSTTKRPQQYIEVTFNKIKIPTAKYPVNLRFLYAIKTGLIQKIEEKKYSY